jgi:hypothetical protein
MTIQNIQQLGTVVLFCGTETANWSLDQFKQAANNARSMGISALLVKVADGGNLWYSAIGGWKTVLDTINQSGIVAIPYTYSYGNRFGAITSEIAILSDAMRYTGIVVADLEVEWNGQVGWAQQMSAALSPIPGLFGVTTWADPQLQNWNGVLAALKPCVNFWLPQVYSDYLAAGYHAQFDPLQLPYFPVLNLGSDVGPNNIMGIAQNAHSPLIALWEYQSVAAYASTVKAIVALFQQSSVATLEAQIATLTAQNTKLSNALQQIGTIAKGVS